jgi:hypothetical protein
MEGAALRKAELARTAIHQQNQRQNHSYEFSKKIADLGSDANLFFFPSSVLLNFFSLVQTSSLETKNEQWRCC